MGGIIDVLSPRDQKLMKQIIIAHSLLRTHTLSARRPSFRHQPGTWGGAALCQGARLTLSLLSATGHIALMQIFAGRLNQRGAGPFCSG